jgi:DNA-binding transcriptional MocR family regulator
VTDSNIILMRGQWLRSHRKLKQDLGASPKGIIKAIAWLEETNLLRTETTQLGTIFTVLNFDTYQGKEQKEALPVGKHRFPQGNTKEAERFPQGNGERFPQGNNTKNYKPTKNYKEKEDSVNNLYSVKGANYDERDTSTIEWDKYPHLRF